MESGEVVPVLAALAQETRLEVFRLLVQAGPNGVAAGEIAREIGIPAQTLSFHLRAMSHAGLVAARREGRSLYYSANFEALNDVIAFLTENCCARDARRAPARRGRRAARAGG
jgi:DNA-binding transcriptional ArsR family regulator